MIQREEENAVMTKTIIRKDQNGRVQKQLEVQTLIRAFSHQYYKLLFYSVSRSLTLSTLLPFVIFLI